MKKLILLFAFAFIGGQAFSQIYIVSVVAGEENACSGQSRTIVMVEPSGNQVKVCIDERIENGALADLNQALNSVINQGYKLVETIANDGIAYSALVTTSPGYSNPRGLINQNITFIFAIP